MTEKQKEQKKFFIFKVLIREFVNGDNLTEYEKISEHIMSFVMDDVEWDRGIILRQLYNLYPNAHAFRIEDGLMTYNWNVDKEKGITLDSTYPSKEEIATTE